MNRNEYRKLLLDDRWKEKAKYIKTRDKYTCQECGKKDCLLDVHHKNYILGSKPWEIPSRYLITLCRLCHKKEHTKKPINKFYITKEQFKEKRKEIGGFRKTRRNYKNKRK